ncbi:hypothetical protein Purlil1_4966 [Purpureocillium lilacinum]|uniref:Cation-transporting P-type ATPase N-terminal domain-containing protein n=1 Tax=Purpureocillium lilacinum TaxID=33203 RepID=A0ABR0C3P1_PURLI|nr:hypothetical protein Purlil1_4966 [Purpureocillium lilacinum]GJN71859.1 hypothetical protein PLICBS_005928 [Purpureocillium lilacinum]
MSSEKAVEAQAAERVRWGDEEQARGRRDSRSRPQSRSGSRESLAIRSIHSRGQVDPSLTLPIQYRTVSFQIEESKAKDRVEAIKAASSAAKDLSDLEWHTITPDEVAKRLTTTPSSGLSRDQVQRRQQEYGRNAPSPPKTNRAWTIFGYFFKGFGGILLVGSILVFVSWKPLGEPAPALANLALAIVLLAVFFIQAAFAMFQDWSTSRVMASIKDMLPEQCQVIRDNNVVSVPAEELVPGDVVHIKSGNKLPADVRFIQISSDAKFDRSVLTGESRPVPATVKNTDVNYLETHNIGLQGTHCIIGSGVGIVVATGDRTVFGRIAVLTSEPKTKMTTLEREVLYFVLFICAIMFTMIVVVLIVWGAWLRRDHPDFISVSALIVSCVSVAVAFIPEGLPIAITAGLTITANMMKKNMILCKSLKTVETLGSVSVICSDKTGTLTQGKMTLTDCSIGTNNMTVKDLQEKMASSEKAGALGPFGQLGALAALCNAAELDAAQADVSIDKRNIFGDATDTAVLRFSESLSAGNVGYFRGCWQRVFELAFNSKNKFMIRCFNISRREALQNTLHADAAASFSDSDLLLTMKGAPDVLLGRCTQYLTPSGVLADIDEHVAATLEHVKNIYSSQGKRCLLLARKVIPADMVKAVPETVEYEQEMMVHAKTGLTLVGLVAIVDPLRPEIRDVVSTLRGAGIRIAMVTGDFALTALAISREAGIVTCVNVDGVANLERYSDTGSGSGSDEADELKDKSSPFTRGAIVISGPELTTLNENQWRLLTEYEEIVFARTTPEQKLRIVREFQNNNVVAMTGDGVNDAPSLKAADVGISMGSGSDIAMEAADMVLLDTFSSVVIAVQYGRVVFDNLKKVIAYLLPAGSFSEFWPVITNVVFGLPQILSSFLMIVICCFTDCAAATVLSFEKPEADVLLRRPRNVKKDRLVNWQLIFQAYGIIGMTETITSFAMSYWYLQRSGILFKDLWFGFGVVPSYVDPDYYNQKLTEASSIYFVNLVVMQWFNLMATRTRRLSIFQHPPLFNKETQNLYLFPSILFALAMAFLWLYPPAIQEVIVTSAVPVEYWFLPFAFGIYIILIDEARRFWVRKYPKGWVARAAW